MAYAKHTKVPIEQSRVEIENTLMRYGATAFMVASQFDRATIMFEANERRIRFDLPLLSVAAAKTVAGQETAKQENRRRWRALCLCIKAKLESVESKIETFEEAFLSHVVMPDGTTVGDYARPRIAEVYKGGGMIPLLPGPRGA